MQEEEEDGKKYVSESHALLLSPFNSYWEKRQITIKKKKKVERKILVWGWGRVQGYSLEAGDK